MLYLKFLLLSLLLLLFLLLLLLNIFVFWSRRGLHQKKLVLTLLADLATASARGYRIKKAVVGVTDLVAAL